jgi:predicted naringenin-chalcone synthase
LTTAYLNRIATAVPPHDIHAAFVAFAGTLLENRHDKAVLARLVDRAQIAHRFSVLAPAADPTGVSVDTGRFYTRGHFPAIAPRMRLYEQHALGLATQAAAGLDLGPDTRRITHVIVTSCTGLYAPGLDIELVERLGLDPSAERTMIGFMGCYAAVNALKVARHIVRSEPTSRILVVNLELCSLHLQEASTVEQLLSFLVFGDGCAASLVSADPGGLALDRFHAALIPETAGLITWKIRNTAFDMVLSGQVPSAIEAGLAAASAAILDGAPPSAIDRWAVHPGGRTVLDAAERGLGLGPQALASSRGVLSRYGNMSSATIMFVLQTILGAATRGERGCAMSFGPGLTAETMLFRKV